VLELGSGSGDLTLPLSERVDAIDAVEPSLPMLELARARVLAERRGGNVRFVQSGAEDFVSDGDYALAVAAESLHWMEWSIVLPALARWLRPGGRLAMTGVRMVVELPFQAQLWPLVAAHSTNRDFKRYDLAQELTRRGLFRELGRRECSTPRFAQSVDDYVESYHSRNGFSRERMAPGAADAFDRELRALIAPHAPDGVVTGKVTCTVIWGEPLACQS
jgi:ubiquinone/menaquinone biosynthesis C-methylase UbiE